MKSRIFRFNTYLLLLLAALLTACQSSGSKKKKELTNIGLHIEENLDGTGRNGPVQIGRTQPFTVVMHKSPFLNELNIEDAGVVNAVGGYEIVLQFDRQGAWLLEQYSTSYRGKRVGILCQFGQSRWIAAPVFQRRITDGVLSFTPDATREEAERIVNGLKNVAKKVRKGTM